MKTLNRNMCIFTFFVLSCIVYATPVLADVPTIQNVTFWTNDAGRTILNVTVNHFTPNPSIHYVDMIVTNNNGTIQGFGIDPPQQSQTFNVLCDLGQVSGTPSITIRAHCNVDLDGPTYGPIQVPEFSLLLLIALTFAITLIILGSKRINLGHFSHP